jgi:AcrR family transcriptional regulator
MKVNKNKIKSEQSKKQIIEATIRLLAEKGYGLTSIADISHATGMTKGALYHHFSGKEDIFDFAVQTIADMIENSIIENDTSYESVIKQLDNLFEKFIHLFEENNYSILILSSFVLKMDVNRASYAQPFIEMLEKLTAFVERIISKGQANHEISSEFDSKLLSLNIIGVLLGNTIPWMFSKDRTNYRVIMQSQKDMLFKAIAYQR